MEESLRKLQRKKKKVYKAPEKEFTKEFLHEQRKKVYEIILQRLV